MFMLNINMFNTTRGKSQIYVQEMLCQQGGTICHPPGILFASWGKKRNFYCSSVWLPEAALSTNPLLRWLRNPSIFPLYILCSFTCHCTNSSFTRDPDPSTMTHPCKVHKLHHYVREIVGNNQKQSETLWETRRALQPKGDPEQLI